MHLVYPQKKTLTGFTLLSLICLLGSSCDLDKGGSVIPFVSTLNTDYNRLNARTLVRKITIPTKQNLDFAAYSSNVMLFDSTTTVVKPLEKIKIAKLGFGGLLTNLIVNLDASPLTGAEKANPFAWSPIEATLLNWNFEKGAAIANAQSTIGGERWGDESEVSRPFQEIQTLWIHTEGNLKEVWVELEFKPWMTEHLDGIVDPDNDGVCEVYAKLSSALFTKELLEQIQGEYATKKLTEKEVVDWANQLAAYWYPTYNTDVMDLTGTTQWPFADTEEKIMKELGKQVFNDPVAIFRGRPFNEPVYNVFIVDGMGKRKANTVGGGAIANRKVDPQAAKNAETLAGTIASELLVNGRTWSNWKNKLVPFYNQASTIENSDASDVMGLVGNNNFLVFRRELEYLKFGDLDSLPIAKQPVPAIAAFKNQLKELGIDFLFIPVPTKQDIYPEIVGKSSTIPTGTAQPYLRKLLADLSAQGVETIDLLRPFQEARNQAADGKKLLYQLQDTHWSTLGLELAAQIISQRVQAYPWYTQKFQNLIEYHVRDSIFDKLGDIHGKLTASNKVKFGSEKVLGRRVLLPDETPYEDKETSPVLVIGDSYTGVYQTVDCKNAGVTAHLAKGLGGPVDLIMGWGGGPEAPEKMAKRGPDYLNNKRLVIWVMSARDIFVYQGDWNSPAKAK